jgi:4-hydroxybenzoate polyprenyltransferase
MDQTVARDFYVKLPWHLLRAMRPHHWVKNLVVFAAPLFALRLDGESLVPAALSFAVFSLVSSSFYLINDAVDVQADREHPVKRHRPIAAGLVPVPLAIAAAAVFLGGSLVTGFALSAGLGAALGLYALVQTGYNLGLKRQPVLDIMCISAGFVLRALGGAAATGVPVSGWFVFCVGLLAFYLGLEKRRAELKAQGNRGTTRAVLRQYTLPWLARMESLVTATTLMAYALWTLEGAKTPWMLATVPFVAYGIFRYQYLSEKGEGEAPESLLMKNPHILLTVLLWAVTCLVVLQLAT